MDDAILRTLTVETLSESYRRGERDPVEVTVACLEAAARHSGLNAFVGLSADAALADAAASRDRWRSRTQRGPLDGIPITVKDSMSLSGWPTLKGSLHSDAGAKAGDDAPSVARLRTAGVVILGKTTTPEFAWKGVGDSPRHGITRNPWDQRMTTGGSSAGAAAAAAAGIGVLHTGTDGAGSVRMPAAMCGVVTLKPTAGLIPIHPPSTGATLSHVGPLVRTVRDAAHFMAVTAAPDPREVYPVPADHRSWFTGLDDGVRGMKVAYSRDYGYADVAPDVAAAVDTCVQRLADLGAQIVERDPGFACPRDDFLVIWDALLGRTLRPVPESQWHLSDPGLVETAHRARGRSVDDYLDAESARVSVTMALGRLFSDVDLLVSPTLPITAFPVGQDTPSGAGHWLDWTPFTYPHNLSRCPAASVPIGVDRDGLPIGLQIVATHFRDRDVLRAAQTVESVMPMPALPGR